MEHYFSILEQTIKRDWDRPALCNYRGETFSFCQMAENIEKFHIFFKEAGIKKGEKIALSAKNTARWANTFLAINTYETVVVPILSDFTPEAVCHLTDHSEARILFTDKEIWEKMDIALMPKVIAVVDNSDYTLLYCANKDVQAAFDNIDANFKKKYPLGFSRENVCYPKDNQKDISIINYTSGTTSAPKGVMLRYECFSAMVEFASRNVYVDDEDEIVSMLPMGHIYGLAFEFIYPLCNGCTIHYLGKTPSPTLLLKAMKDVKPYMVCTVPLVMEKVYKSSIKPVISKWYMKVLLALPGIGKVIYRKIGQKLEEAFGGKVRNFIMGGAALNPEVEKVFRKIGIRYTVGYGMTEASPLLAYADAAVYAPGSCGRPVDCAEVKIDSEDPQHIAGEILAKGLNICSGYFNNPEASANAFTEDGYLRTGDLGIMDKDGNIFIKGRCKTMILSANGQNIYPEELEAVINNQNYVSESVVVDRAGALIALVYLDSDSIKKDKLDQETVSDIPEQIRHNVNRIFPKYSQISKVEVVLAPFEKTPKMSIKRFMYK
ncbi:MAG: AMP-binding protein [Bacteroidales bacterium]|nr:AMP-binding protein [Bacteroidales bacterium]